jgi:hypothetical protein
MKNSFRTSQEILHLRYKDHSVNDICGNSKNHTEHTNTICAENAEFWYVEPDGAYSNHWLLNG